MEKEPYRRALIDQKIAPKNGRQNFYSLTDGVKLIREGNFVFYGLDTTVYPVVKDTFEEDEKCGLRQIDFMAQGHPIFPIAKQSPHKELLRVK